MDELDKLYNDENLPDGKRKQRIIAIADNIINQLLKEDSNLVDAQIIAEIVNIGIRDIVDTGWMDNKIDPKIVLTDRQKEKLLGDGWTWEKYRYDDYF